jgi:hypothetical protein
MRRLLLYHAVVCSVLASASLCSAQDSLPTSISPTAHQTASGHLDPRPEKSLRTLSFSPVVTSLNNVLNVTTAYVTLPRETLRLKDLPAELDPDHSLTIAAKSSFFEGRLMTEGEVSYLTQGSALQANGASRQRQGRLSLIGTEGRLRYGLNYRVAGKAALGLQDVEMREVWAEWRHNIMHLTTSLQQNWNNVDLDPAQARITRFQMRTSAGIAPPGWPALTVSYAHVTLASAYEPQGVGLQRAAADSTDALLTYTHSRFQFTAASSYLKMTDKLQSGFDTVSMSHVVGGIYHPIERVSLTPTLTWRTEEQRWSGNWIESPSLALSFSYESLLKSFGFSLHGVYGTARSSDRLVDSRATSAKGIFTWTLQGSRLVKPNITVEARYGMAADHVYADRSTEDSCILVRLKLTGVVWTEFFSFNSRS